MSGLGFRDLRWFVVVAGGDVFEAATWGKRVHRLSWFMRLSSRLLNHEKTLRFFSELRGEHLMEADVVLGISPGAQRTRRPSTPHTPHAPQTLNSQP